MPRNNDNSVSDAPIYTDRRRRSGGSGSLGFIIFLILLLVLVTGGSFWLYFGQINKNAVLRQEVINLNQSMSLVREALQITDESITDQYKERDQKLKILQEEINKLWILTNKKQKLQIQELKSQASANKSAIQQTDASHDQLRKNLALLNESHNSANAQLTEQLAVIEKQISDLQLGGMVDEVKSNSKTLASLKNSRAALNSRMAKLQQEISLVKNKLLIMENSQAIPSHDLEKLGQ